MTTDNSIQGALPSARIHYLPEDYFLINSNLEWIDSLDTKVKTFGPEIREVGSAFISNLLSVFNNASALWVYARRAGMEAGYLMMTGVCVGVERGSGIRIDKSHVNKAREEVNSALEEPKWRDGLSELSNSLARNTMTDFLNHPISRNCARDICRQSLVSIWGAFEVLVSDLFVILLNTHPRKTAKLLSDERTKKYYQQKDIATALVEYEYNLSDKMGTVLLEQRKLDDVNTIRSVYDILLDHNPQITISLSDEKLWMLYQYRNLIVHRAAIIDSKFIANTGVKVSIGSDLIIKPDEVVSYLEFVTRIGEQILDSVSLLDERSS